MTKYPLLHFTKTKKSYTITESIRRKADKNLANAEKSGNYTIRTMREEDYDAVRDLWMSIHRFRIRSIDDSREGVVRFIRRNPTTSVVAEMNGEIVGTILCGHDGRQGYFYHVCVREDVRKRGIGKAMATAAMLALKKAHINKVMLVAFKDNSVGNAFWRDEGWTEVGDFNQYEFVLNEENIARFNA